MRWNEAPDTVATVLVLEGSDPPVTPFQVREAFKQSYENQGKLQWLGTKTEFDDEDVDAGDNKKRKKDGDAGDNKQRKKDGGAGDSKRKK